jgi:hypothetical protein
MSLSNDNEDPITDRNARDRYPDSMVLGLLPLFASQEDVRRPRTDTTQSNKTFIIDREHVTWVTNTLEAQSTELSTIERKRQEQNTSSLSRIKNTQTTDPTDEFHGEIKLEQEDGRPTLAEEYTRAHTTTSRVGQQTELCMYDDAGSTIPATQDNALGTELNEVEFSNILEEVSGLLEQESEGTKENGNSTIKMEATHDSTRRRPINVRRMSNASLDRMIEGVSCLIESTQSPEPEASPGKGHGIEVLASTSALEEGCDSMSEVVDAITIRASMNDLQKDLDSTEDEYPFLGDKPLVWVDTTERASDILNLQSAMIQHPRSGAWRVTAASVHIEYDTAQLEYERTKKDQAPTATSQQCL